MADYYVMSVQRQQIRQRLQFKGDIKKLSIDFSSWSDDNSSVSSVTWTVENGSVSIGTETLASNVASMILTSANPGTSMIKCLATDGTHSEAIYIKVVTKDPQVVSAIPDYGLVLC